MSWDPDGSKAPRIFRDVGAVQHMRRPAPRPYAQTRGLALATQPSPPSAPRIHRRRGAAALSLALLLTTFIVLLRLASPPPEFESGQGATPTPDFETPITTALTAISSCLTLIAVDNNPHGAVARLITYDMLRQFTGEPFPWASSQTPVWLVGLLADNYSITDANPIIAADATLTARHDAPADGLYCAFDASSGGLVIQSPLVASDPDNYSTLVNLSSLPLPIPLVTALYFATGAATDASE